MKKQIPLIATIIMALGSIRSAAAQEYLKHIVQPYETVYSIPVHYNITTNDFLAVNHFDVHIKLLPGSEVLVRELTPEDIELAKSDKPIETMPKKLTRYETLLAEERAKTNSTPAPVTKPETTKTPELVAVAPAKIIEPFVAAPIKSAAPVVASSAKQTEVKENLASDKTEDIGPNGIKYKISKTGYHFVEPKQTLFHLALIYNQTVEKLKQINSLPTTTIVVGQNLKVSN